MRVLVDGELMALVDGLGAQIGLFLGRKQAEEQAAELLEREHLARADVNAAVRDDLVASISHDLRVAAHSNPRLRGSGAVDAVLGDQNRALEALTNIDTGGEVLSQRPRRTD